MTMCCCCCCDEDKEVIKEVPTNNLATSGKADGNHNVPVITTEPKTFDNYTLEEWLDKEESKFPERWKTGTKSEGTLDDFDVISQLGDGTFGRVFLVRSKVSRKYYAMKAISKKKVIAKNQITNTRNEKNVLMMAKFPFLVSMRRYFQDTYNLYYVMEFVIGGEFYYHLRKQKRLKESHAQFYAAQVILAFEYLHRLNLIYRDLKPENILLCSDGYIKVTDFGFTKPVTTGRTWTLCGTPEFLAPEIILHKSYYKAVDWWALGVFIYEMVWGVSPFASPTDDQMEIYEKIVGGNPTYPPTFSPELKDLLKNLLQVDLTRRYGNLKNGVNDIKGHQWFTSINWESIFHKKVTPPFIPDTVSPEDTKYFPPARSNRAIDLIPPENELDPKLNEHFKNF